MNTLAPSFMMDLVEGKFASTNRQQLADVFATFKGSSKTTMVVYFHGGLVSKDDGVANALDLNSRYSDQAQCLFPIWETGIYEVFERDWANIALDTVFQVVRDRVMSAVHAKVLETTGTRGLTLDYQPGTFTPSDLADSAMGPGDVSTVRTDLDYSKLEALTPFQEKQLELAFAQDSKLVDEFHAAVNAHVGAADSATRSAFTNPQIAPKPSVMDEEALDALVAESADFRGLPLGLALRVLGLVKNVIARFLQHKDHGLHATATEEILRMFYIAAAGQSVWGQMKRYARNAFDAGSEYGGTALLEQIGQLPDGKRVMLIGHSAGAIFISELLLAANRANMNAQVDVVFLAPAVRADLFADALNNASNLMRNFRIYTMTDENECRDILVRTDKQGHGLDWFYPRSLLYFIAGILEPEVDSPIIGMRRFHDPQVWNANEAAVKTVREYAATPSPVRVCWSVSNNPDVKLRANARSHGDFGHSQMLNNEHNTTVDAIREILRTGTF